MDIQLSENKDINIGLTDSNNNINSNSNFDIKNNISNNFINEEKKNNDLYEKPRYINNNVNLYENSEIKNNNNNSNDNNYKNSGIYINATPGKDEDIKINNTVKYIIKILI